MKWNKNIQILECIGICPFKISILQINISVSISASTILFCSLQNVSTFLTRLAYGNHHINKVKELFQPVQKITGPVMQGLAVLQISK